MLNIGTSLRVRHHMFISRKKYYYICRGWSSIGNSINNSNSNISSSKTTFDLDVLLLDAQKAAKKYSLCTQHQINSVFHSCAMKALKERIPLAISAANETGFGVAEDKVAKNHFAAEYTYNAFKDVQTCGIIEDNGPHGIIKIVEPLGVIAALTPVTNPTSTVIYKTLLALKSRNAIVFSPHPRAINCSIETASMMRDVVVKELGEWAKGLVSWIPEPNKDIACSLMSHKNVNLIWATGGQTMARQAIQSTSPALVAGAGNTPAIIDETADIEQAVSDILLSKSFDNGMICAAENSVVVVDDIYDYVKSEFELRGAVLLDSQDIERLRKFIDPSVLKNDHNGEKKKRSNSISLEIVGHTSADIAKVASLTNTRITSSTRALIAEVSGVGIEEPWSKEKLSPLLAMYRAPDWKSAIMLAKNLVMNGGRGHTAVYHTQIPNEANKVNVSNAPSTKTTTMSVNERYHFFETTIPASTLLINSPASHGAIGDGYNVYLDPVLSITGGSAGQKRINPHTFLRFKTLSTRRDHYLWMKLPPKIIFGANSLESGLIETIPPNIRRAIVVTDRGVVSLGYATRVMAIIESKGIVAELFDEIEPDPSFETILKGVQKLHNYQPDIIIALGGGSPMDAAKVMKLIYNHPEIQEKGLGLEGITTRFMDITRRTFPFPKRQEHEDKNNTYSTSHSKWVKDIGLICIPTTSGTGSEVTPFAVVTDSKTHRKFAAADYYMTPQAAIIDGELATSLSKPLLAATSFDALTHAIESYVSVLASDFTKPLSLKAIHMLNDHMIDAYEGDKSARHKVHHAASIAGMAIANAFVGIGHSLAHQLGSEFGLPHGICCSLALPHVISYNSTEAPVKQTPFPQYTHPETVERYANIADVMQLSKSLPNDADATKKIDVLVQSLNDLQTALNLPQSVKEAGIQSVDYQKRITLLMINVQ